jgi:hypothetical protein
MHWPEQTARYILLDLPSVARADAHKQNGAGLCGSCLDIETGLRKPGPRVSL